MSRFQVISLDMFQTLVDVDKRLPHIWKPLLKDGYSDARSAEFGELMLNIFAARLKEMKEGNQFLLVRELFESSFQELFHTRNIQADSQQAAEILFQEHTLAEFYEETESFLRAALQNHRLCILSDADNAMIPSFYTRYDMMLFTSEQHQSYKNDFKNSLFQKMIAHYNIEPSQAIHIGDSPSDVLGAKRAGIAACWINRNGRTWGHEIQPDYTVQSLDQALEIFS